MTAAEPQRPRGNDLTTLRLALAANGYRPVPVSGPSMSVNSAGKRPLMKNWREVCASADTAEIARWTQAEPNCTNTGLLCGELVGVDVDVLAPDLADKIAATARILLGGDPLVRIGKAPKLLLCYRAAAPFSKIETPEIMLPDSSKAQVEVLAAGQQFVSHGIHPDTGKAYSWPKGAPEVVRLEDLPAVTEADLRVFVSAAEGILRAAGGRTQAEIDGKAPKAIPPDTPRPTPSAGGKVIDFPKAPGKGGFFMEVNRIALTAIDAWFPTIFPSAQLQLGTGAWRVSSATLGRQLEEDLSMHPTEGGMDWGTRESCSPIDVVIQWGGAADATQAALWLCEKIGADPAGLGWKEKARKERKEKGGANLSDVDGFARNEDGIALAFADKFKDQLRYCHSTGAWFVWTGSRWEREETKLAFSWARQICRELNDISEDKLAKASTAAAVERFAQADRAFAVTASIWDTDHFQLGTPGGVVNLKTGAITSAQPSAYITKLTTVAPAAPGTPHPGWSAFLEDATRGDRDLQRFLQQMAGYCLTGDVSEECLFFVYGLGGNGKGVFLKTLGNILGDYATSADMATFTASTGDRHPTDLAKLKGARLVTASETEEGRPWAEARIKEITGNERPVSARFMRQDFFEYWPTFKLVFVGNHKPVLRNVDDAAKRRFNIIPFVHKPENPDKGLKDRLRAEYPAILRWMIEGCLDWRRNGLTRPAVVTEATNEYFSEQDTLRQWIEECCETGGRNVSDTTANLFASWSRFAEAQGERPGTTRSFTQTLQKQGYEPVRETPGHRFKRGFLRIRVKPVDTSNQWQNRMERDHD